MRTTRPLETVSLRLAGTPRLRDPFREPHAPLMASVDDSLHVPAPRDPPHATLRVDGLEPLTDPRLPSVLAEARLLGFGSIDLQADAALLAREGVASRLADAGVTKLRCRLLSSNPVGCALLTGAAGAFQAVQSGLRRALEAGLSLEVAAVLLDPRVLEPGLAVQQVAHVRSAARCAAPKVTLAFVLSDTTWGLRGEHGLRPVPLADLAARVDVACRLAQETHLDVRLPEYGGLPPCLFATLPTAAARVSFRVRRAPPSREGRTHGPRCAACAYRRACQGIPTAWAEARGTGDLAPLPRRLPGLTGKPGDRKTRRWTEPEIAAARESDLKVLRLTMRCNQACIFCPSDDTSENIDHGHASRLKRLARWHQAGVRRLSFSGGEPTLDPSLPSLIGTAASLGFPDIEVVTNAVRLADPDYAKRLVDAGLTQATVSLHSHLAAESDALTCGRAGDFDRTLRGLDHLLASDRLRVYINHVIHAANAAALPDFVRFVSDRFGSRPTVTFAALTPLYRALDRPDLWPRLSDVAGPLKVALDEGTARGLALEVLARPGIPPCILAPDHLAFSDLSGVAAQVVSEDAHKKTKPASCAECRFDASCGGVWKAYAERFGLDELVPVSS